MIPVSICVFKKALVKRWSITVAFVLATLVCLLIRGVKLLRNVKLTIFFTFKFLS